MFKKIFSSSTSKDALVSLVGNALVAAAGMIFSIVLARSLSGPAEFGIMSALLSLGIILGSLGDIGVTSALINFLPKQPANRQSILSFAFWCQIIIGLTMITVMLGLIPFGNRLIPGTQPSHFFTLGLLGFVLTLEVFSVAIFKAEKKFFLAALIATMDSWLKILFILLIVWKGELRIITVLLASLTASTLTTLFGLTFEIRGLRLAFPRQHAREIFQFTKWISIMSVFSVFIGRIDVIMLNALGNSFDAGIFAAAARVALVFVLIVSSLGSVVSPRFSSFVDKNTTKKYLNKLILMTTGVALFMLLIAALAPNIINLVFGAKYQPAIPVFRALTIAMIPFLYTIVTVNPLIYTFSRPDLIAKLTVIQVLFIITINWLLIPRIGAYAPTIALAVSNLFVLGFTSLKLRQLLA